MTYTVLGAAYANPDNTAAVLKTVEAGDVIASAADTPELWAQVLQGTVQPYAPPPIPGEVTMRQAQLAMLAFTYPDGSNLLDKVNALVAQQPRSSQITWNASSAVKRSNALVAALQPALGLTDAQVNQLFVTAAGFTE